jgi:hypothetical protein
MSVNQVEYGVLHGFKKVRTNIGNVAALDDAVAAFIQTERVSGKTIVRARPKATRACLCASPAVALSNEVISATGSNRGISAAIVEEMLKDDMAKNIRYHPRPEDAAGLWRRVDYSSTSQAMRR